MNYSPKSNRDFTIPSNQEKSLLTNHKSNLSIARLSSIWDFLTGRWSILFIFAAAFALRLYRLGFKPFWQDEGVTWYIGNGILTSDAHPAFYFYLMQKSLHWLGNDEFAGRFLSALCGALTVLFLYYLVKKLFNQHIALIISLLAAVNPYLIAMSQEMRMYALVGLEFILLLSAFFRILSPAKPIQKNYIWWILLFLVGIAGLNTHAVMDFQLVFISILFVMFNWRKAPKRLLAWGGLLLAWGILYIPTFLRIAGIAGSRHHIWVSHSLRELFRNVSFMLRSGYLMITGDLFDVFFTSPTNLPLTGIVLFLIALTALVLLSVVFLIRFLRTASRKERSVDRTWVISLYLMVIFNIIFFLFLETSSPNHLVTLFLSIVLITAFLFSSLNRTWRVILTITLTVVMLISTIAYYRAPSLYYDGITWSTIGKYMTKECKDSDIIIVFGNRNMFYTIKYYGDDIPCAMYYIGMSKWKRDPYQIALDFERNPYPVQLVLEYLNTHPRVWIIAPSNWIRELQASPKLSVELNLNKRPGIHLLLITKVKSE